MVLPPRSISGMADPLSIVASIISVIVAVEGLKKTLGQIKNLSNAPDEVFVLINEVSDFDIISKHIEELITDDDEAMAAHGYLEHMPRLIEKAQDQLLQLEHLIRGQLLKPKGPKGNLAVSRIQWTMTKKKMNNLRMDLRNIRLNVVAQLASTSWCVVMHRTPCHLAKTS